MKYKFTTQNPHTHKTKSKAKEQHFYCCSSSYRHSDAVNIVEQTLTSHVHYASVNFYLKQENCISAKVSVRIEISLHKFLVLHVITSFTSYCSLM